MKKKGKATARLIILIVLILMISTMKVEANASVEVRYKTTKLDIKVYRGNLTTIVPGHLIGNIENTGNETGQIKIEIENKESGTRIEQAEWGKTGETYNDNIIARLILDKLEENDIISFDIYMGITDVENAEKIQKFHYKVRVQEKQDGNWKDIYSAVDSEIPITIIDEDNNKISEWKDEKDDDDGFIPGFEAIYLLSIFVVVGFVKYRKFKKT